MRTSIKKISAWLFILFGVGLASAQYSLAETIGDEVTINYSGTVVIPPCVLATDHITVKFGDLDVGKFADSAYSVSSPIELDFTQCSGIENITMSVSGDMDTSNAQLFRSTGTATHVGIELSGGDGTPLTNGMAMEKPVNADGTANIKLNAAIKNDHGGDVTPGSVQSIITLNFTYR